MASPCRPGRGALDLVRPPALRVTPAVWVRPRGQQEAALCPPALQGSLQRPLAQGGRGGAAHAQRERREAAGDAMRRCRALPAAVGALCRALPPRARLAPDVLRRARFDRPQAVSPGRGPPLLRSPRFMRAGWILAASPCGAEPRRARPCGSSRSSCSFADAGFLEAALRSLETNPRGRVDRV